MTRIMFTMTAAALLGGLLAPSVEGQNKLEAAIPFDFQAGAKSLPAGKYDVHFNVIHGTLVVRNQKTNDSVFVIIHGAYSNQTRPPAIVFERFGDRHLLSTVWNVGGQGYKVPKVQIDKELAKLMRQKPELAEVALRVPAKR